MKTKTIAVIAALSLLPAIGFAQPPSAPNPPNPPNAPIPPVPPNPPKDRDRDRDNGPKVPVTFLGVETSEIPRVVSEQLGLAKGFGLVVDYVVPDGPAATAGIQQNDILKMFNDQILMQPDQLAKLVRSYSEGTNVTLTILRKGQESKITVKLGKKEISSRKDFFGPDYDKHRHHNDNDLGMNFDFGNLPDMSDLKDLGPSIRDVVKDAHREALRASAEARREAMRESGEARREAMRATEEARREVMRAAEEARRAAKEIHVFSTDNGAMKSTTIDLGKAQIVVTDPKGELKIESANGKKMLTAKDPQGRLLFSGPVDSKEDLDKVPADVRQRYDKLEQKDLPGVISTVSTDEEDMTNNDNDNDEDADDDSDDDDGNAPSMQQVSYQAFSRSIRMVNVTSI
jgi:serine protease Do